MAKDKKSFVLYSNWITTFEKLSNEEAGILIKLIFDYVNDKSPIPSSRLFELLFEPIKQQLKIDLVKWGVAMDKKRHSGILGNLKRWHDDLYQKVINNQMNIEEANDIAQHRTASHTDKKHRTPKESIASIAVNDNVNVNVINIYSDFISIFNRITKRDFKGDEKSKRQFNARIKEGATLEEFENAITVCSKDPYHIENKQYLTPEFITRSDKFQKYNIKQVKKVEVKPIPASDIFTMVAEYDKHSK